MNLPHVCVSPSVLPQYCEEILGFTLLTVYIYMTDHIL